MVNLMIGVDIDYSEYLLLDYSEKAIERISKAISKGDMVTSTDVRITIEDLLNTYQIKKSSCHNCDKGERMELMRSWLWKHCPHCGREL